MSIDYPMEDPFAKVHPPQHPEKKTLSIGDMANTYTLYMDNAFTQFIDERSQAPQGENLSIAEIASAYTRFVDDARKKANKLLLEEQKNKIKNLLGTIEVNPGGDEMQNHEDITLRSGG